MVKRNKKRSALWMGIFFLSVFVFFELAVPVYSYAQSVSLTKPPGTRRSGFGGRTAPCRGCSSNHSGVDYATPIGTRFSTNGSVNYCRWHNGYGNYAISSHACCVEERYGHLNQCGGGGNQLVSGNTGRSTGPHVHYEVAIRGVLVDPEQALSAGNLCDKATQDRLIAGGRRANVNPNGGGSNQGEACTSAQPPQQQIPQQTYVPPGGTNPTTGQPTSTTGPGMIIIETSDGRTYTETVISGDDNFQPLPPSITDGFTQSTSNATELTGCATDTWKAMVNQSVLQTRREMAINERLITKPDSVWSYACHNTPMSEISQNGGMFSESQHWVNKQIDIVGKTVTVNRELGTTSLDGAIDNAAKKLAAGYIISHFGHGWLGGTAAGSSSGIDADGDMDSINSEQNETNCDIMQKIWNMAKCTNITDDPGFPTFAEMIGNDPRKYPSNMQCNDSGISQGMIDIARGQEVKFDKITTYLDMLMPNNNTCYSTPFATGVTVHRQEGSDIITREQTYPDGVCISPGCSYQNEGGSGNGTCQVK
jgi:hypothetical protein